MMTHIDEFTLNEYADNALSDEQRAEIEAHLHQCADCQAELAELQQLFFALESAAEASFTVDVSTTVAQQIEQEKVVGSEQFSVNSGLLLVFEIAATAVLLFLLWPTMQNWLLLAQNWQTQLIGNVNWPTPVSWAKIAAQFTAVFDQFQAVPQVDLATMQWGILLSVALLMWLAGNRLLFTNDSR